jgi:hypothetical protein
MRLPYPKWINIGDLTRPKSIEEAIGILIGFSTQIEIHKIQTLSKYSSLGTLGWDELHRIYTTIGVDLNHVSMLSLFEDPLKPTVRGSPDLDYALESIAKIRDPAITASITLSIVVPAYIAILEFISSRTQIERVRKTFSDILRDERRSLEELLEILSKRFEGKSAAEALEERAVILFASAAAEDALKVSIASIVSNAILDEVSANVVLGGLYKNIDKARIYVAERLYVDSEAIVSTISRFGLSGLALC